MLEFEHSTSIKLIWSPLWYQQGFSRGTFSILVLVVSKGRKPTVAPPFQRNTVILNHCARFFPLSRYRPNRFPLLCGSASFHLHQLHMVQGKSVTTLKLSPIVSPPLPLSEFSWNSSSSSPVGPWSCSPSSPVWTSGHQVPQPPLNLLPPPLRPPPSAPPPSSRCPFASPSPLVLAAALAPLPPPKPRPHVPFPRHTLLPNGAHLDKRSDLTPPQLVRGLTCTSKTRDLTAIRRAELGLKRGTRIR